MLRGWPISFAGCEASVISWLSRNHCRKRRRRNHGALPSRGPCIRCAVPSRVRAYPRWQENPCPIPCNRTKACHAASARYFQMNSSISLSAFESPLPLLKGERIEVRGSKIERELKLQTLTLPSHRKGEADQSANASKGSQT